MAQKALREPAILNLIFPQLGPIDLLRVQRVCYAWRQILTTDRIFLRILSLHPEDPHTTSQDPAVTLNPLLKGLFPSFFYGWTYFGGQWSNNAGPWRLTAERYWTPEFDNCRKFSYPNASWRRMLPYYPPPQHFEVHVQDRKRKTIARLNFDNESSWLTFGLIHDIVENAWMHGSPWWLYEVELEHPGHEPSLHRKYDHAVKYPIPPGTNTVYLYLTVDSRTQDERLRALKEGIVERKKSIKRQERRIIKLCGTRPRRVTELDEHVFTGEFHAEGSRGFGDVEWDEVEVIELEGGDEEEEEHAPVPPPPPPPVRSTRRILFGLWRK